ncbi:MAG: histidine kinase dimerization/phospho-acceptor domain-containing protein [Gemmatimonadota bacterium]
MILHLAPDHPDAEVLRSRLSTGAEVRQLGSLDALRDFLGAESGPESGFLILGPGLPADACLQALALATDSPGRWVTLLADSDGQSLRSFSLGWPESPDRVVELEKWAAEAEASHESPANGAPPRPILELRHSLRMVARIRHDVNNPLTAAMVEVQLLLMDLEEGTELTESVELVQEQLRRIRDEIAELARLRAPRAPGAGLTLS